ncbi:MAG: hypothetical protein JXA87_06610 [Thermoleophilia bacterium]|nr:hypothetical protein [Thermoleophilia bacterium]
MAEHERTPEPAEDERRLVLTHLQRLLSTIGSANDAEDHGYGDDAASMREESSEAIRSLIAEHPLLEEVLPDLRRELDTGHVFGFGWADLYRATEVLLAGDQPAKVLLTDDRPAKVLLTDDRPVEAPVESQSLCPLAQELGGS